MKTAREKKLDKALTIASQFLSDAGTCTHYPGYICDKGFPTACPACIRRWILTKAN
jgi:hypothetical protein